MRLLGFKYFNKYRIALLALILTLTSTLFTITALSLLGFYEGFNTYLGEGEDIVVIYDKGSRTPFTGLVPTYLADNISLVNGVLAYSLETIAPCMVNGYPVFIRGVIPRSFFNLTRITMVNGLNIELNDTSSIIVGLNAANRLKLNPGDKVMVLGVLNNQYLELTVKGIYISYSPLDDEVIAPLYVGQWLRGIDYNLATLIRVKADRNRFDLSGLIKAEDRISGEDKPSSKPLPVFHLPSGSKLIGVEEAYKFMRSYLDKYGLTRETIMITATIIFIFASISFLNAQLAFISQHEYEVNVLRALGASWRALRLDLIVKFLPLSIISSIAGFLIGTIILIAANSNNYIQLLLHRITLQLNPLILALNIILAAMLTIVGIILTAK